jgi:hypothetical protein
MLTDAACRDTKPGAKIKKLAEGGLQLWIFPNGSRLWRYAYAIRGKRKLLALGAYPKVSLLDARIARDAAKTLREAGRNSADSWLPSWRPTSPSRSPMTT